MFPLYTLYSPLRPGFVLTILPCSRYTVHRLRFPFTSTIRAYYLNLLGNQFKNRGKPDLLKKIQVISLKYLVNLRISYNLYSLGCTGNIVAVHSINTHMISFMPLPRELVWKAVRKKLKSLKETRQCILMM